MAVVGPSIPEYLFYPDAPPSVIGKLATGLSVVIELWKGSQRINVAPSLSGCTEIGNTGKYAWSMAGLPPMQKTREQYSFRMTDNGANTDVGDFIVVSSPQIVGMPSISDSSSYLIPRG